MSLITTTEVQAMGIGLALSDAQLQTVIDREEAEIVRRFGANYVASPPISETVHGCTPSLYLKRAIGSVSSIVEYAYPGDTAPVTLTSQDYYVWNGEGRIERLPWGVQPAARWGTPVVVSYVPVDDTNLRKQVLLALVQIAVDSVAPNSSGKDVSGLGYRLGSGNSTPNWTDLRAVQYARLGWLS